MPKTEKKTKKTKDNSGKLVTFKNAKALLKAHAAGGLPKKTFLAADDRDVTFFAPMTKAQKVENPNQSDDRGDYVVCADSLDNLLAALFKVGGLKNIKVEV